MQRGDSVKNWKNRYFVAYNEADNFKIDYHDGSDAKGKLKGTIYCAGYSAYHFNSSDEAEFGEFGIKLVPWSYRRRTWYIKCADETERKEWMPVFENACYKSIPPRDEDEAIASAFDSALRNVRWWYGFWGWYSDAGSEGERLGEFILDLLDREVLRQIIDGIVDGPARSMTVDLIRKTVGGSVKAAAGSAWVSSVTAVRGMSDSVQSSVKELLNPLLEKQKVFKAQIVEKVMGTVKPFLADKGATVLKPVLNVVFKPVTQSFINAAKGFHSHMASKISDGGFASASFTETLNHCDWQMDWWYGPINKGFEVIYRMYNSDLIELASLFVGGITPYTVYNMVMDKMKLIIHRAVYTFGQMAKAANESQIMHVLGQVTSMLFYDCVLMIQSVISDVLKALINAPLQENVITPCKDLIEPLQSAIDSIPIPGLPMLFDLPTMLDEVVDSIVSESVTALISGSVADIKTQFAVVSAEVGVAELTIQLVQEVVL